MNNRLLEYESPSEDELVSRLLSSLHRALDENFPDSTNSAGTSKRFSRTEFSAVSEDTIVERTPGPAAGDSGAADAMPSIPIPPPPPRVSTAARPSPPAAQAGRPEPRVDAARPKSEAPSSLVLPSGLTDVSRPLSRTQVASNATTGFHSEQFGKPSNKGFSLKLFAFMFAVLLGVAIGSVVFLFWAR